jgi:hypothetical protein
VSQADRLLALLQTGPKTTAQLLREVPCIVHSRIAELRERDLNIVCERIPGEGANAYRYTLEEGGAERLGPDGPPSSSVSGVLPSPSLPDERRSAPQQLTVWAA